MCISPFPHGLYAGTNGMMGFPLIAMEIASIIA